MRASSKTIAKARRLRRTMTPPEVALWKDLRGDTLGARFRRQHAVGPYILDFYCAAARLAVEVDGAVHDHPEQVAHDGARTAWLGRAGIAVLRFNAGDILDPERRLDTLDTIAAALAGAPSTACCGPPPPPCGGG